MIRHMAVFNLYHAAGSPEEAAFLSQAEYLGTLPGVQNFRVWRQTSRQAPYAFAICMEFGSEPEFRAYMMDPEHLNFAHDKWYPHVSSTMDVNFEPL